MRWKIVTPDYNLYPTPMDWLDAESPWGLVRVLLNLNVDSVYILLRDLQPHLINVWWCKYGGSIRHDFGKDRSLDSINWTGWQMLVEDTDGISGMEELPNVVDQQLDTAEPRNVLSNNG